MFDEEEMMRDLAAADAAGDTELAQEIAGLIRSQRATTAPPASEKGRLESAGDLLEGFTGRLGTAFDKRKDELSETYTRAAEDRPDFLEDPVGNVKQTASTALQLAGKGVAGPIADVIGETVSTGIGAVSDLIHPDIRQGFNDLIGGVADSPYAKQAAEYYNRLSPEAQSNVESIFNVGTVLAPVKLKPKVMSKAFHLKREKLRNMFQPIRDTKNVQKELYHGTKFTDDMLDDLADVKGISPTYSPDKNIKNLRRHMNKLEAKIARGLDDIDSRNIHFRNKDFIIERVDSIVNESPFITKMGLTSKQLDDIKMSIGRKVEGIYKVEGKPSSLKGLLKMRRELDGQIQDSTFRKSMEGKVGELAAQDRVMLELRKTINGTVSGIVEKNSDLLKSNTIKNLLKKQSSVYSALDNYTTRKAMILSGEASKGGLIGAVTQHPFLTYQALRNQGSPAAAAFMMSAPSLLNLGGEGISAGRRLFNTPRVPLVRSGLFYNEPQQQQQEKETEEYR